MGGSRICPVQLTGYAEGGTDSPLLAPALCVPVSRGGCRGERRLPILLTNLNDRQAAILCSAGRLLQSDAWPGGAVKIVRRKGESYPQAVARVIDETQSVDSRDRLRELAKWVREYESVEAEQGGAFRKDRFP